MINAIIKMIVKMLGCVSPQNPKKCFNVSILSTLSFIFLKIVFRAF